MWNMVLAAALVAATGQATGDAGPPNPAPGLNTAQIEKLTGARGWFDEREGTFRVSVPRTDVGIYVVGTRLTPQQGLTSWAIFQGSGEQTRVTGEMVLTEEQVAPALKTALDEGLEVTALHAAFLWDQPRVVFLGIRGSGEEAGMAFAVGQLLSQIHDPRRTPDCRYLRARNMPPKGKLNLRRLESILGFKGELQRGVYKVVLPGANASESAELSPSFGNQTWMAFAGIDSRAMVNGEISVTAKTLQPVLKALVTGGLMVTNLHTPVIRDAGSVSFVHYWGVGTSEQLAGALKSVLEASLR